MNPCSYALSVTADRHASLELLEAFLRNIATTRTTALAAFGTALTSTNISHPLKKLSAKTPQLLNRRPGSPQAPPLNPKLNSLSPKP